MTSAQQNKLKAAINCIEMYLNDEDGEVDLTVLGTAMDLIKSSLPNEEDIT